MYMEFIISLSMIIITGLLGGSLSSFIYNVRKDKRKARIARTLISLEISANTSLAKIANEFNLTYASPFSTSIFEKYVSEIQAFDDSIAAHIVAYYLSLSSSILIMKETQKIAGKRVNVWREMEDEIIKSGEKVVQEIASKYYHVIDQKEFSRQLDEFRSYRKKNKI
jgi:hypothetical protein